MTTWAATGYGSRLIEVAALADVARLRRLRRALATTRCRRSFCRCCSQAGKVVIVCLVKMREADAPAFVAHFQQEVLSRMPSGRPRRPGHPAAHREQLADPSTRRPVPHPAHQPGRAVLGDPGRRRARHTGPLGPALLYSARRTSCSAWPATTWPPCEAGRHVVQQGQIEFDTRYRREYLTTEKFHRFDEALVRLLDLLELPGIGRVLSTTSWVVRTPYRLLKGLFNKAMGRPEQTELARSGRCWSTRLAAGSTHPQGGRLPRLDTTRVWATHPPGFQSGSG